VLEFPFEPGELDRAEQVGIRTVLARWPFVGAAVTAHIKQKQVEQRTLGDFSIDAARF
jgi:hypothetical protein